MYGLVNKAVYQLIHHNHGQETWVRVREKAGLVDDDFISMESYPDEITYRLVSAAADVLNISSREVLEAFGEYWITYTAQEGYGSLLQLAGNSFLDFLTNLDQLHSCVGQIMPSLDPPLFQCTDVTADTLRLHHYSKRKGLEHMVVGLIKGLGKRFNSDCTITIEETTSSGADHNVFHVTWKPA